MVPFATLSLMLLACQIPPLTQPKYAPLRVGDAAPPLAVDRWLSGHPVDLKDGKVHVVEFWATYCLHCILAMPHLSDLADRYQKDVVFTDIDVWEPHYAHDRRGDALKRVQTFVSGAHRIMRFAVGMDDVKNTLATSWLVASGQEGIPATFIVGRSGKVAWMGLPGAQFDEALEHVIASDMVGTWSTPAITDAQRQKLFDAYFAAKKCRDYTAIVNACDQLMLAGQDCVMYGVPAKYIALRHVDRLAADRFAQTILKDYGNSPYILVNVACAIANDDSGIFDSKDFRFAKSLMKSALRYIAPDGAIESIYIDVLAKCGDLDGARYWQARAIRLERESKNDPGTIQYLENKLVNYESTRVAQSSN